MLNVIFNDASGAKLFSDRILLLSPWMVIVAAGLGISMAGMWSGMDDDKNLNANENEVGFGEMLNVLYSGVVI